MKKLSPRHHHLLIKRARAGTIRRRIKRVGTQANSFQPFKVEMWDGNSVELALCLEKPKKPPSILCFDTNTEETLQFLNTLRKNVKGSKSKREKGVGWLQRGRKGLPKLRNYYDFANINMFSTAPALVLSAIYERAKETFGEVPPAIDFPNWSPQAFQTLYEIGFFEIIGHSPAPKVREVYVEKQDASYKVSKILTGRNADGLKDSSDVILELLDYLSVDPSVSEDLITDINSAVSEAMINVARHAYPAHFVNGTTNLCLRQWWMSARADREDNKLTIVVYDQGATIPGTLPNREWFRKFVEAAMRTIIPHYEYARDSGTIDHEFINYSMKEGKTQTGDVRRGLGLPQMQSLIDICPDGTLSILSRKGLYKYGKDLGVYKSGLSADLEGTLIEWELTLPRGTSR